MSPMQTYRSAVVEEVVDDEKIVIATAGMLRLLTRDALPRKDGRTAVGTVATHEPSTKSGYGMPWARGISAKEQT